MDLQGQPISSGQRGVKVTTDPASDRQPIHEPSGPVINDSLPASYNQNRGAQPLGVSSKSSTTHDTDTSAAKELPPAHAATDRGNPHKQEKYPEALGGQEGFPGAHIPESGYVGGSTAAKKDLGINKHEYRVSEKLPQSQPQPQSGARASGSGYQTRSATAAAAGQSNKQRGDFPDDPKYNASFNSDIGDENDPGRFAENKFQRREAETSAGAAPARKGTGDRTWYQPLSSDQGA